VKTRIDGAWRDVSEGRLFLNGAWRRLVSAKAYIGGAWRDVASFVQPMAFSVTPESVFRLEQPGNTATSQLVTGTPTGGRAPFTYVWTHLSGDTGIGITSPTAASTRFERFSFADSSFSAVFQCACTDANGTTLTDTVTVTFQFLNIVGGV